MTASEFTFDELVAAGVIEIGDGHRAKSSELTGGGPLFLRAGALSKSGFEWSGLEAFGRPNAPGNKRGRAGDVVVTTKGNSIGRVGWVPSCAPDFVYSPHLSYWRALDESMVCARYMFCWARGPEFRRQLHTLGFQTDMAPYLSLRDQGKLRIALPPIGRQRAIAEVLGALDDKIATNARLRVAVDELLAARFAACVVGRDAEPLRNVASVNTKKVAPRQEGSLRYIDITSLGIGEYEWPDPIEWSEAPGRARRGLGAGDTIWSTVRPNRRSHALVVDDDASLVASTGLAVLGATDGCPATLYEATRTAAFLAYLEAAAEGSAYPAVRAERFLDAPVPALSASERTAFEAFAWPLRVRAHLAAVESRALAGLRDTLLPALMSGRLTVKHAEDSASEVV